MLPSSFGASGGASPHTADQYVIPGWLARAAGGVLLIVLPWVAWMTVAVVGLDAKLGVLQESSRSGSMQEDHGRISAIEASMAERLGRMDRYETRISRLEAKGP